MTRRRGPRRRKTIPRSRCRRRRNPARPSAPPSHSRRRGASARNSDPAASSGWHRRRMVAERLTERHEGRQLGRSRPGTSSWSPETRRRTVGGQQCPGPALGQKSRVPSFRSNNGCRTTGSAATFRSCLRPSARRRAGTCYRAASKVGMTQDRGNAWKERASAVKVKPLRRDCRRSLDKWTVTPRPNA